MYKINTRSGSSTPSSKLPVKPNSSTGHPRNRGGGKEGHKGHGRASISEQDADKVEKLTIANVCPDCGSTLEEKGTRARAVIDCQPVKMKKIVYHLERKRCPKCKKVISARAQGVLAKCLYSNRLLAYVAVQHYIYGNTLGQIEKQTGVGYSSLIDAMHQLAKRLKGVPKTLIGAYRDSPVKHCDFFSCVVCVLFFIGFFRSNLARPDENGQVIGSSEFGRAPCALELDVVLLGVVLVVVVAEHLDDELEKLDQESHRFPEVFTEFHGDILSFTRGVAFQNISLRRRLCHYLN